MTPTVAIAVSIFFLLALQWIDIRGGDCLLFPSPPPSSARGPAKGTTPADFSAKENALASSEMATTTRSSSSPFDVFSKRTNLLLSQTHNDSTLSVESYRYKGLPNLTYRYLPASRGRENDTPLLLVHPVGIGMGAWYWDKFTEAWKEEQTPENNEGRTRRRRQQRQGHPSIYAVNLIGCGAQDGSSTIKTVDNKNDDGVDAVDSRSRIIFSATSLPNEWVKACQHLIRTVIVPRHGGSSRLRHFLPSLSPSSSTGGNGGCHVVVQGGLAPIGILLAAAEPTLVKKLVLASPPTYEEMTTAVPPKELERNYNFLSSPFLGDAAFRILESRSAIAYFSNLFLFDAKNAPCDENWVQQAIDEARPDVRPPVQVFNAGYCMQQSLQEQIMSLSQPVLILEGDKDKRRKDRQDYQASMKNCVLETLPGKNVLPYESPAETVAAIRRFLGN